MKRSFYLVAAALLAASLAAQTTDLDAPKETPNAKPDIWVKAAAADAKAAEDAARKDACVRLVAAAYQLEVANNRDVYDMMLKNSQVDKALIAALADAAPNDAQYLEDGTVRVTVTATPAQVVAILKKAYAKVDWDKAEEDAVIDAAGSRAKKDALLTATGEGALPGSLGEKRIPVRRAALVKAEQEIAVQVLSMVLRDDYHKQDHVHDFCLGIREGQKKLALGLSLARVYTEEWAEDGSVDLKAEVNAKPVIHLLYLARDLYDRRNTYRDWGWSGMINAAEDMILQGSAKAKPADVPPPAAPLAVELKAVDEAMKAALAAGK